MDTHPPAVIRSVASRVERLSGHLARKAAYRLGLNIDRQQPIRGLQAQYLSQLGPMSLIVDVGVGEGTRWLWDAWPLASLLLVEPAQTNEPAILANLDGRLAEISWSAATSEDGPERTLHFEVDEPTKSSLHQRSHLTKTGNAIESVSVRAAALDTIVRDSGYADALSASSGQTILKIDTEGHELQVLQGASQTLMSIDFVLLECSFSRRFENSYRPSQIVSELSKYGLEPFEIVSTIYERGTVGTRYCDILFARQT